MIKAFKNTLYMIGIIHKVDRTRIFITLIYNLWVVFVQLVFMNLLFRYLINAYETNTPFSIVFVVLMILWITQIGYSVFSNYYNNVYIPVSDEKIRKHFQLLIFKQAIAISMKNLDNPEYYNDFKKASNEANTRAVSCLNNIMAAISDIIFIGILAFVIIKISWIFLIISFLPIALNIVIGDRVNKLIFDKDMKAVPFEREVDYVKRAFFLKEHSKEIKISNIKAVLFKQLEDAIDEIQRINRTYGIKIAFYKIVTLVFNDVICYFLSILFVIFLYVFRSAILLGDFVFIITSLNSLTDRVQKCINDIFSIYNGNDYIENIKKYLLVHNHEETLRTEKLVDDFEKIQFENVSFKYEEKDKYVLRNVSLTIEKGKKIAIVGHNGAGKSTLIKLILKLYDSTEGRILLDDRPIENYNPKDYRSLYSCIFQDFAVFGCTIGENILCRKVTEEDKDLIQETLEISGFSEEMKKNGYSIDDIVTKEFDENGLVLSGGQLQKLAIARAFALDKKIILLDEPTSAIDPIAEYEMFERLKNVYKNKTLIYVSHRLSSAILADIVYFFENGQLIEFGSHKELLKLNRQYARMFNLQAAQYSNINVKEDIYAET